MSTLTQSELAKLLKLSEECATRPLTTKELAFLVKLTKPQKQRKTNRRRTKTTREELVASRRRANVKRQLTNSIALIRRVRRADMLQEAALIDPGNREAQEAWARAWPYASTDRTLLTWLQRNHPARYEAATDLIRSEEIQSSII